MVHRLIGASTILGIISVSFAVTATLRAEPAAGPASGFDRPAAAQELRKDLRIYLAQAKDDLLLQGAPPAKGGDDLLLQGAPPAAAPAPATSITSPEDEARKKRLADEEHARLFIESKYPSANTCSTCHPKQYREWSVSQHAYAQLSPVFFAFQMTVNSLTSSTNGDFCVRCHTQVGMNLGESIFASNLDRPATSREGVTCVVCHRVNRNYGKVSGRLALEQGDLFKPVSGPTGDKELKRVLSLPQQYRVVTSKDQPGRDIHTDVQKFFELTQPSFCGMCHDVTLLNGFRLEEAFSEFKQSPAASAGVTCQDCHMGKEQGVASGFDIGPAAIVGGVPTRPRKVTDHYFAGPDYPIIHPGIFPHNVEAAQFKNLREWLQFDYKAGWGTKQFEDHVPAGYKFPKAWESVDDRFDGRKILDEQFARLKVAREKRLQVLRNGFKLGDIRVTRNDADGLKFEIDVFNGTTGHGVPTGFDAERMNFLQVTVTDADGMVIYKSGDRDPNGDVRDSHSLYVHDGKLPLDPDLFTLQTKFIVRLNRGGEREQILPVNTSVSVLPFVRPETRATTIYGRPAGARKHKENIEPNGYRTATYSVDASALTGKAPYKIDFKFIAQMVPVNLLTAIQGVGFDYGMSPKEIGDAVVAGAHLVWEKTLVVGGTAGSGKQAQASER